MKQAPQAFTEGVVFLELTRYLVVRIRKGVRVNLWYPPTICWQNTPQFIPRF